MVIKSQPICLKKRISRLMVVKAAHTILKIYNAANPLFGLPCSQVQGNEISRPSGKVMLK
jgi:hypothetical protein